MTDTDTSPQDRGEGHGGAHGHAETQGHGHSHGHAHAHAHGGGPQEDYDWGAMAAHLEREGEIGLATLGEAARWLRGLLEAPAGAADSGGARAPGDPVRRVLDVGSGPGIAATVLAGTFPDARVLAVDGSPFLLERARDRAARAGVPEERFGTLAAELPARFGALGEDADLIWSSRAIHHLGDQEGALRHLAGALRPGGLLAIAEAGLGPRFLPRDLGPGLGRPGLQARIEALQEDWFTRMRAGLPGSVRTAEHWPALLTAAGLTPAGTRTFVTEHPAPLGGAAGDTVREHLRGQLARQRERFADGLDAGDLRTLDALLDDGSPEGVLRRPDAFFLAATTVHTAVRSGR